MLKYKNSCIRITVLASLLIIISISCFVYYRDSLFKSLNVDLKGYEIVYGKEVKLDNLDFFGYHGKCLRNIYVPRYELRLNIFKYWYNIIFLLLVVSSFIAFSCSNILSMSFWYFSMFSFLPILLNKSQ